MNAFTDNMVGSKFMKMILMILYNEQPMMVVIDCFYVYFIYCNNIFFYSESFINNKISYNFSKGGNLEDGVKSYELSKTNS